ncbi:MAG TPA: hypothetical protein VL443_20645 [Cyclobacteriaceae bacterium]|jgi:hypothetical protein|nr:hypothetical protein [Cyclobacteriaceae bacterium]
MVTQKSFSSLTKTFEEERFRNYLNHVRNLLRWVSIKNVKILPSTSLYEDLKLHHNDYYFLKLDIEEMTRAEIDLDEIYECVQVMDVVRLLIAKVRKGTMLMKGPAYYQ